MHLIIQMIILTFEIKINDNNKFIGKSLNSYNK